MTNHLMKQNNRRWLPLLGMVAFVGLFPSCEKDILTGQPEWLGNSIYERLEEGIEVNGEKQTFKTMLRLIDDLDQKEVLSRTGSKTVFASSDQAYEEWFASNEWGVTKYEDLTMAQKKLLFNNAMIDNSYLLELMSNVSGNPPQHGMCMRRESAVSIYDSIPEMTVEEMPVNPLGLTSRDTWTSLREAGKTIHIMKDDYAAPMIHFLPEFMSKNNITDNDLYVLSNHESNSTADSWINGKKVVSSEQTCKNGYIYVVDGVMGSNKSMAEIIHGNNNTKLWSHLLMRFAVPYYNSSIQATYRRLYNTNDTIYTLRYFNTETKHALTQTPSGINIRTGTLSFDPGWNQYIYNNSMDYDMHYDAGAMIVPTDAALKDWWENGSGEALREEYHEWDSVPYATIAELINVNMLKSFVDAVPSKFGSILDDAKVELGITSDDVKAAYMGCNGVVYLTDKVFGPSSFRSVIYPTLAHQSSTFAVMYQAIVDYDFKPYLNSMDSKFSLIVPFNNKPSQDGENSTFWYLDPCSYGQDSMQIIFEFYKDEEKDALAAKRHYCTIDENGNILLNENASIPDASSTVIQNRMEYLLNNSIIVGEVWNASQEYYRTKGGSMIRVENGADDNTVTFQGGYQMENGTYSKVEKVYNMLNTTTDASGSVKSSGNGKTYAMSSETLVPLTASQSVYQVLSDYRDSGKDSLFLKLLEEDESSENGDLPFLLSKSSNYYCTAYAQGNKNIRLFDNYNYTVYVPTDESMKELFEGEDAILPTWDDYKAYQAIAEQGDADAAIYCKQIAAIIHDFVRYHFQDNSIYINSTAGIDNYETGKINPANRRFYSLEVTVDSRSLTIKDYLTQAEEKETGTSSEHRSHVLTGADNLWNRTCCEYWISGSPTSYERTIASSSHVVVHQIDAPLFFSQTQKVGWKKRVEEAIAATHKE